MTKHPASNLQRLTPPGPAVARRPFIGWWISFLMVLCLGGRFGSELSATESTAIQTNAPGMRIVAESDMLSLLTDTLQRVYVKDRGELELICKQPWPKLQLPDKPLTVKILELPTAGVTSSFIVRFQLCTEQGSLGTWQTTVQAHVWRMVWVAHSTLRRGELVSGADVIRERCDVLNVREALADFSATDPNLELAAAVTPGVPLLARHIKPRVVIHRGQTANALLQDGMLSISAKVVALEDGAPGDTIRARNPASSRYMSGKVLDEQTILISL